MHIQSVKSASLIFQTYLKVEKLLPFQENNKEHKMKTQLLIMGQTDKQTNRQVKRDEDRQSDKISFCFTRVQEDILHKNIILAKT